MRFDTGSHLPRQTCPTCNAYVAVTNSRRFRKHGPKANPCPASNTPAPRK